LGSTSPIGPLDKNIHTPKTDKAAIGFLSTNGEMRFGVFLVARGMTFQQEASLLALIGVNNAVGLDGGHARALYLASESASGLPLPGDYSIPMYYGGVGSSKGRGNGARQSTCFLLRLRNGG
jgi:hypothetical protein